MFRTTIRVRRPRKRILDAHLSTEQLQKFTGEAVEVMAHGKVVAIIDKPTSSRPQLLWHHPDVDLELRVWHELVAGACALMLAAKAGGLCDTPEAPEASGPAIRGRRRSRSEA